MTTIGEVQSIALIHTVTKYLAYTRTLPIFDDYFLDTIPRAKLKPVLFRLLEITAFEYLLRYLIRVSRLSILQ